MINPSMSGLEKIRATLKYLGSQPNSKQILGDLWTGTDNTGFFNTRPSALPSAPRQQAAPAPVTPPQGAPQFTPYMQPPSYWEQALPYAQWGQQYQMPSLYTRPPQMQLPQPMLGMGGGVPGYPGLFG